MAYQYQYATSAANNLYQLLQAQNAAGLTAALFSGWEPNEVLIAKIVTNATSGEQSLTVGAPAFVGPAGTIAFQITNSINSYLQGVLQNTSSGTTASTDFIVNNNLGTDSANYADFGINSSTFVGSGPINIAGGAYLYNQSGDLSLGTAGAKTLHLFTNNVDALTINSAGVVTAANSITAPFFASSNTIDPSDGGVFRLANLDFIGWETNPDGADNQLTVDATNRFTFSSTKVATSGTEGAIVATTTYNQASGNASGIDLRLTRIETAVGSGTQAFEQFFGGVAGATLKWQVDSGGVPTIAAAVATPAGGATTARLLFGTTAGFGIYYGSGIPTVSAAQGSIYMRSDAASNVTRAYINTNGSTTWTAINTVG